MTKLNGFLVTSVTPGCHVNLTWFRTLETLAKIKRLQLIIGVTSAPAIKGAKSWTWPAELEPYIVTQAKVLCPKLTFRGDYALNSNSQNPVRGLVPSSNLVSDLYAAPIQALKVVPSPRDSGRRIIATTGSLTEPSLGTNASRNASQYHCLGALIVEVDQGYFYLRQIQALDGGARVRDLDLEVKKVGDEYVYNYGHKVEALILGDTHYANTSQDALDVSLFDYDSMAEVLRPKRIIFHDLVDFRAQNHHSKGDWMQQSQATNTRVELEYLGISQFLADLQAQFPKTEILLADSNHDRALQRWMSEFVPAHDPANMRFFVKVASLFFNNPDSPLTEVLLKTYKPELRASVLNRNEAYLVGDFDCAQHGDVGVNGSRSFNPRGLNHPTVSGHTHEPSMRWPNFVCGHTSNNDHGYNNGYSSWLWANTVIYEGSAASLLILVQTDELGTKWRA